MQFQGPSATAGYADNRDETRALISADWLETGDRGYVAEGELYITGRIKDIIIRGGRNIYPHELEAAVGELPGVRKGCVAVVGRASNTAGPEQLVVLAETRITDARQRAELTRAISRRTLEIVEIEPDEVVLLPPRSVPKTSSGKIKRTRARALYEEGLLGKKLAPSLFQLVRFALSGVTPLFRRARRVSRELLYACYTYLVFSVLAPCTWLLVVITPGEKNRRKLVRYASRLLFSLGGIRLSVQGIENLPSQGNCVIVSNHASYLDGVVLSAALPPRFSFVAKRELADQLIAHAFLSRIGTQYVDRVDPASGVRDAAQIQHSVDEGKSVVFFPEGTFFREPGLQPFRMGAFLTAATRSLPVTPVILRGTRSILRGVQFFPSHGAISVTIRPPIEPTGSDWHAALKLRDATRKQILAHCNEPDVISSS